MILWPEPGNFSSNTLNVDMNFSSVIGSYSIRIGLPPMDSFPFSVKSRLALLMGKMLRDLLVW